MVLFLQTTHLDLVAATALHLDAELAGQRQLGKLLGVAVPRNWPPPGIDQAFLQGFRSRLGAGGHDAIGWYGWYAVCRRTALQPAILVGLGCFFGPPDTQGRVELGFTILPEFRGRGHATEMVQALTNHALGQTGVECVVADLRANDRATLAVLLRSGFVLVEHPPEPGLLRCERTRGMAAAAVDTEEPDDGDEDVDDDEREMSGDP